MLSPPMSSAWLSFRYLPYWTKFSATCRASSRVGSRIRLARHAGAGAAAGEDVQHRQGEAGGLAGAGLRAAQHVAAHQHEGDGLRLDRRRAADSPCRARRAGSARTGPAGAKPSASAAASSATRLSASASSDSGAGSDSVAASVSAAVTARLGGLRRICGRCGALPLRFGHSLLGRSGQRRCVARHGLQSSPTAPCSALRSQEYRTKIGPVRVEVSRAHTRSAQAALFAWRSYRQKTLKKSRLTVAP